MVSSLHISVCNVIIHKILKTQKLLKKVPFFAPNICALLILCPPSLKHPSPPLKIPAGLDKNIQINRVAGERFFLVTQN